MRKATWASVNRFHTPEGAEAWKKTGTAVASGAEALLQQHALTPSLLKFAQLYPHRMKKGMFCAYLDKLKNAEKLAPAELQYIPKFLAKSKVTDAAAITFLHKHGVDNLSEFTPAQLRSYLKGLESYYVKDQGPYVALEDFYNLIDLASLDARTLGTLAQAVSRPGDFVTRLTDHATSRVDKDSVELYVAYPSFAQLCEDSSSLRTALRNHAGDIVFNADNQGELLARLWKASAFLGAVDVRAPLLEKIKLLQGDDLIPVLSQSRLLDRPWRRALKEAVLDTEVQQHGVARIGGKQSEYWVEILTGEVEVDDILESLIPKALETNASAASSCFLAKPSEELLRRHDWANLLPSDADRLLRTPCDDAYYMVKNAAEAQCAALPAQTLASFLLGIPESERIAKELRERLWKLDIQQLHKLEVQLMKRDPTLPILEQLRWRFNREILKMDVTWNRSIASKYTNYAVQRYLN
eukprot:GEMP01059482.1.p1 GENE.GEMP01059482.1~~GEMP01059482.1.p1  ORF type:complete len:476 (-),score=101.67 GEMP01059482.1:18-1421(-)